MFPIICCQMFVWALAFGFRIYNVHLLTYSYLFISSFGCKISDNKQNFWVVYPRLKVFLIEPRNLFLWQRFNWEFDLDWLNRHCVHDIKRVIRIVLSLRAAHVLDSQRRSALGEISTHSLTYRSNGVRISQVGTIERRNLILGKRGQLC